MLSINFQKVTADTGLLVLHQKGKDAVCWPLKSLRRYGAEADVFSFESGRKCDTGPGIYAFRLASSSTWKNLRTFKIDLPLQV